MTAEQTQRSERLSHLAQTAADTPMGTLLRRFWQPVAVSRQLVAGKALPLKILGEELTLYRGVSGQPCVIGARCAHRRTLLHTGWVEGEEIRCIYHGWCYDGSGQCTARPAEGDHGVPPVKIAGYPVHEYAGMVFAWFDASPAPEFDLPCKDAFEREG